MQGEFDCVKYYVADIVRTRLTAFGTELYYNESVISAYEDVHTCSVVCIHTYSQSVGGIFFFFGGASAVLTC